MMPGSPQISIVLPVYNGSKYLKAAIESLLVQTFTDFEFLVLNDGSTDDTEAIIQLFTDERIVYHKNIVNKGLVETLNIGVAMAKGVYVARMDADDVSYPDRLQLQYEYLEQHPDVGVCGAQMRVMGTDQIVPYPVENDEIFFGFLKNNMMAHPVVTFRKQVYVDNGLKYDNHYFPAEDYILWVNFSRVSKLHNLPVPLLDYNIHAESISVSKKEVQMKKMDEIKALHLLRSLDCYSEQAAGIIKTAFHFEFKNDQVYLLDLHAVLQTVFEQNDKLKAFNEQQLKDLLGFYWYVACKECLRSGVKVLKIYSSNKAATFNYRLKLTVNYFLSFTK